jgi:hypothetical protein
VGKVIDVAVMRDKSSGRSRGFAFVTFVVYSDNPQHVKNPEQCQAVRDLNNRMLRPNEPHLVQGRAVEIR